MRCPLIHCFWHCRLCCSPRYPPCCNVRLHSSSQAALGFGDVTTTLLIGLAVGMFGLFPVVFWWFAISVLGLLWLAIWTRFDPQKHTRFAGKTPFAPTIVVAGAISIAMHALC